MATASQREPALSGLAQSPAIGQNANLRKKSANRAIELVRPVATAGTPGMPKKAPHRIAVLAFDGLVAGDLAAPCEIFQLAETLDGRRPYDVQVCASKPRVRTHAYDLHIRARLDVARHAQTVIVPGLADPSHDVPRDILELIRHAHAAVAANSARLAVVPLERAGGQAQFIVRPTPASHTDLTPLLHWIESRLAQNLTVGALADQAAVSVRTLNRRFQELLGVSPLQWVIQARVNRARGMLETTDLPVERVAMEVGFGSAVSLREHFTGIVGTSPMGYRRAFRRAG